MCIYADIFMLNLALLLPGRVNPDGHPHTLLHMHGIFATMDVLVILLLVSCQAVGLEQHI